MDDEITRIFTVIDNYGTGTEAREEIEKLLLKAEEETVATVLMYLDKHRNLDDYDIDGAGVTLAGTPHYYNSKLIKDAQKYARKLEKLNGGKDE